ncbi:MAG TPA: thiamine pyrophosphate-binding protein [Chthoniobacteraceae bacterium]|jgi:acetolactate synthase-1/2/3 large subunit|nr:thiamine pyrophosphate-binding protein [Chthoniobacteraceae bacterium]
MSNPEIRLADYAMSLLVAHGVDHIFLVTGGGAMHLNDAIGRCKGLTYLCCHHEQACAMAAESYARLSGRLGAINVTTGPGGLNALNGVFGAWTDSVPMIILSGQVKSETCMAFHDLPGLRQLGDQEADIISMVKGITKYSAIVREPRTIRYHLEKAIYLATHGRPGPCWIDIPIDFQGAKIDPGSLEPFIPGEEPKPAGLDAICGEIRERLAGAARPVLMVGSGIRASGSRDPLLALLERWPIPVVTAWGAHDAIWNDHPCYAGRPGSIGDRPGNFAVQNADVLLVLGSRLNVRQVSYNYPSFARHAYRIMVDVDAAELSKPTLKIDLPVHADLRVFFPAALAQLPLERTPALEGWRAQCKTWLQKYPTVLPEYWRVADAVNPYCFVSKLYDALADDDVVVCGDGTACVVTFQAANLKRDQRLYTNSGCASMGYDLPGAIGAAAALEGRRRVICLAGDGSVQMNIQELQTIATHRLPVKLFILNNKGYHSIRQTQRNFFPDNIVGCGEESGLGFPSFEKLADVYGLPYRAAANHSQLETAIAGTLAEKGAALCELFLDLNQQFAPKLSSKKTPDGKIISPPLEDLAPFLSRSELLENMIVTESETTQIL